MCFHIFTYQLLVHIKVEDNPGMRKYLKRVMARQDINPALLDNPDMILPNQPGMNDDPLMEERYEKGLRFLSSHIKFLLSADFGHF